MTHFSLNLIFDGLKPILTQCKTVAMSAFILSPIALNEQPNLIENKPIQINSINTINHQLTEKEKANFAHFSSTMISLIDTISPFIDFATTIAYENGALISDEQLIELDQKLDLFEILSQQITSKMQQFGLKNSLFVEKLSEFNLKMTTFCDVVKSVKYKAMLDDIVQNRVYTGVDSVGYTYNPEHSFDDFKKAMMI